VIADVSVICTFLNAQDTLSATLASLRDQRDINAEFMLIDDGSDDFSVAISQEFASGDARFALRTNPAPGRGRALNLGVACATSDVVAILDADDVADPSWLADGLSALRRCPEYAAIGFERIVIRDGESVDWATAPQSDGPTVREATRDLARANVMTHSGAVIRRSALTAIGGYDGSLDRLFDYDLWIRMAEAGYRIGLSSKRGIAKRYHDGQKFNRTRAYNLDAWRMQWRAIVAIDRDYRNFLRLGLRIARDTARSLRRAVRNEGMTGSIR
jgi:glycosyltransferase involved in cell wall biosynthesis